MSNSNAERLRELLLEIAVKHPQIASMKTTWELLRFGHFNYSKVRSELGRSPSFSELTKALREAQKEIRERPQLKRRILSEA